MCSADWLESRLKILYKGKGDARDLNNWRGIMLIETTVKIVCSNLGNRIQNFLNKNGLEEQNGFSPGRGSLDGIFSLKVALQKRCEHGLDTWAVFIDLIGVPREGLFVVMERIGFPSEVLQAGSTFSFRSYC
mmetsp:Transcript_37803/g.100444  ORF Transcript_37803/g.100444 Transcript_37803/m.100444 type:complete len:132 (-) Transcript_37803:7-402(-)